MIRMQLGKDNLRNIRMRRKKTDTSTDLAEEAAEDIEENSKLEGLCTKWCPRILSKEFYQLI